MYVDYKKSMYKNYICNNRGNHNEVAAPISYMKSKYSFYILGVKVSKQYNESYKTLTKFFLKKLPCTFFCTLIVILSMYRKRVGSYVYI